MYYYYCMNNYHWKPSEWANMPEREKAIVIAGIQIRIKEEKRAEKDAKRKAKKH